MTLEFFIAVRLLLRTGEVAIFDPVRSSSSPTNFATNRYVSDRVLLL
jgi:hypothetical protein